MSTQQLNGDLAAKAAAKEQTRQQMEAQRQQSMQQNPQPNAPSVGPDAQGWVRPEGTNLIFTTGQPTTFKNSAGEQIYELPWETRLPKGAKVTNVEYNSDGTLNISYLTSEQQATIAQQQRDLSVSQQFWGNFQGGKYQSYAGQYMPLTEAPEGFSLDDFIGFTETTTGMQATFQKTSQAKPETPAAPIETTPTQWGPSSPNGYSFVQMQGVVSGFNALPTEQKLNLLQQQMPETYRKINLDLPSGYVVTALNYDLGSGQIKYSMGLSGDLQAAYSDVAVGQSSKASLSILNARSPTALQNALAIRQQATDVVSGFNALPTEQKLNLLKAQAPTDYQSIMASAPKDSELADVTYVLGVGYQYSFKPNSATQAQQEATLAQSRQFYSSLALSLGKPEIAAFGGKYAPVDVAALTASGLQITDVTEVQMAGPLLPGQSRPTTLQFSTKPINQSGIINLPKNSLSADSLTAGLQPGGFGGERFTQRMIAYRENPVGAVISDVIDVAALTTAGSAIGTKAAVTLVKAGVIGAGINIGVAQAEKYTGIYVNPFGPLTGTPFIQSVSEGKGQLLTLSEVTSAGVQGAIAGVAFEGIAQGVKAAYGASGLAAKVSSTTIGYGMKTEITPVFSDVATKLNPINAIRNTEFYQSISQKIVSRIKPSTSEYLADKPFTEFKPQRQPIKLDVTREEIPFYSESTTGDFNISNKLGTSDKALRIAEQRYGSNTVAPERVVTESTVTKPSTPTSPGDIQLEKFMRQARPIEEIFNEPSANFGQAFPKSSSRLSFGSGNVAKPITQLKEGASWGRVLDKEVSRPDVSYTSVKPTFFGKNKAKPVTQLKYGASWGESGAVATDQASKQTLQLMEQLPKVAAPERVMFGKNIAKPITQLREGAAWGAQLDKAVVRTTQKADVRPVSKSKTSQSAKAAVTVSPIITQSNGVAAGQVPSILSQAPQYPQNSSRYNSEEEVYETLSYPNRTATHNQLSFNTILKVESPTVQTQGVKVRNILKSSDTVSSMLKIDTGINNLSGLGVSAYPILGLKQRSNLGQSPVLNMEQLPDVQQNQRTRAESRSAHMNAFDVPPNAAGDFKLKLKQVSTRRSKKGNSQKRQYPILTATEAFNVFKPTTKRKR